MREYIVNLTNNLIGKFRYHEMFHRMSSKEEFISHVQHDLAITDVADMSAETLGRILCNLKSGDVWAGKKDLIDRLHFNGDYEDLLRELVAICLAYVIKERVDPQSVVNVPPYITKN